MSEDASSSLDKSSIVSAWHRLKHGFSHKIEAQGHALSDSESFGARIQGLERQVQSLRDERSSLSKLLGRQQSTLQQFTELQREKELGSMRIAELENELLIKSEELAVIAVERQFEVQSLEAKREQELEEKKLEHEREIQGLKSEFDEEISKLSTDHERMTKDSQNTWRCVLESKDVEIRRITESYESKFVALEEELLSLKDALRKCESAPRTTSDIERFYKKRLTDMRTYYESKSPLSSTTPKKKISFLLPGNETPEPKSKFTFKKTPNEMNEKPRSSLKDTSKKRKLFSPSQNLFEL